MWNGVTVVRQNFHDCSVYWRLLRGVRGCNDNWTGYFRARSHFDLLTRSVETPQAPERHAEVHSVRWQWGNRIVWAWVLTFPGAAIIGAIFYFLTNFTIRPFHSCSYSSSVIGRQHLASSFIERMTHYQITQPEGFRARTSDHRAYQRFTVSSAYAVIVSFFAQGEYSPTDQR